VIEEDLIVLDADSSQPGPLTGVRLDGVATVPRALGIMAAVLASLVMAFLVIDRIGDWRAELAMHRVLGFSRRQLRRSVAIGSIALGAVVAAIGIPLGVAAGRVAWLFYADRLGVKPEAVVPVGWLALVAGGVIAIAVLAALVPGRLASRRPPAEILRAG
jgi:ABC-type antimicrobial peptide transport system permease subunit